MKLTLTIGHNVGATPTLTHGHVVRVAADVLALDAFTAWQTVGYYHGAAETGTRIEICADKSEVMRIYDAVPRASPRPHARKHLHVNRARRARRRGSRRACSYRTLERIINHGYD